MPKADSQKHNLRIYDFSSAFLIAVLAASIRFYYLATGQFELSFDEAQYWTWSKNLDWGYYSKPPVIAWIIAATTNLCGNGEACIKLASPILHSFTAIFIFLIAKKLYNPETAFWSAITYLFLPAVTLSSAFISTDAPLMFFWAAALYCFVNAIDGFSYKWWGFLGLVCGLGMMSKYTMLVFLPSSFIYLSATITNRHYIRGLHLWSAIFLALLIFTPNLIWNYINNFVSFSHTGDNVFSYGISFYPNEVLEFVSAQLIVFGPILFPIIIWCFIRTSAFWQDERKCLLISFSLPLLSVAVLISLLSSAQAHWAAPVYIAGTILVVRFLLEKKRPVALELSLIIHVILAILFYYFHIFEPFIPLKNNPFLRLHAWNRISASASYALNEYPGSLLASDERKAVASLMYNLRLADGTPYTVLKWNGDKVINDYYDMTSDMNFYKNRDYIFISRSPDISYLSKQVESYEKIRELSISSMKFYIYHINNFKGY